MKTSINKFILGSVLLTASVSACVNEDMTSSGDKVAVQISASTALTRAVDNTWGQNDVIGISMLKAESSDVIAPYSNYNYVTTDGNSNFTPATASQIMYFPVDGSNVSFKAYYPYSSKLPAGMTAPLSVKDQSSLADLDFMTAEHLAGTSKDDPNVKLHFYHRLAKVMIDLTTEDNSISLEGCKLSVKGLKTAGSYDIMNEKLTVDANSTADISILIRNGKGEAIFLPREAGAGVTFQVTTANGGIYTATLKDDVPFKGGYKHTLHIKLTKTPVVISATIEEWLDGPETRSNVIHVVTGLNDSENVKEGDTLHLFLKDQTAYTSAAKFTYNADGKWTTSTPIYWDDIKADPAYFIGTTIIDAKLNDTQMDDILLSKEATVTPFTGVNLELQHAGAKAVVELKSTDGSFSANELAGATITFPSYKYTGKVNAQGEFVINDGTKDIVAKDGVAIFPPQTIKKGDVIAIATIGGRKYEIKATDENFDFGKGIAKKLVADMSKTKVEISTKIIAWTEEKHEFKDVRIGSADLATNEGDLVNGDQLTLYTGTDANRIPQGKPFIYNSTTNKWEYSEPNNLLLWEKMPTTGNIYASIERPAISGGASNNQLPDYITATPVANDGGISNTAVNFEMKHQVAKVIVVLKSNTYNLTDLKDASVVLPSYMTGGTLNKGVFTCGKIEGDIKLPNLAINTENTYVSDAAYLEPQDIAAKKTIVKVTLNNRVYEANKESEVLKYEAGKVTTLFITIEKANIQISTNITKWTDQLPVDFNKGMFFEIGSGNAKDFNNNDEITFYKINSTSKVSGNNKGKVETIGSSKVISLNTPWYRDDFSTNDKILAVFPVQPTTVADEVETFSFASTGTNELKNDLQTAVASIGSNTEITFGFTHALSKVTVNIIKGTGFTDKELEDAANATPSKLNIAMNNFKLGGTVNVANGTATATGSTTDTFLPTKLKTPNTAELEDKSTVKAAVSYEALVMPKQTIANGTIIATVTFNGQTYPAKITKETIFEAGKNYIYNITLNKTGISLSTSVAGWNDKNGGDITIQ